MTVSVRLKRLMKENKMSAPKLSKASGVPVPSIKSILSGQSQNPRGSTLTSLSQALNCTIPELLSDEVITNNEPIIDDDINHISADEIFLQILNIIDKIAQDKQIDLSNNHDFKKNCAKRIFDNTFKSENNKSIDPVYAEWVFESLWEE
ncbi:MAG: helix-turn-helix transcriptional regulator [Proteobacteria bacterium]|nr:helix-turn-helix transcriptional regulator [Pseudomonadota bacterium]